MSDGRMREGAGELKRVDRESHKRLTPWKEGLKERQQKEEDVADHDNIPPKRMDD